MSRHRREERGVLRRRRSRASAPCSRRQLGELVGLRRRSRATSSPTSPATAPPTCSRRTPGTPGARPAPAGTPASPAGRARRTAAQHGQALRSARPRHAERRRARGRGPGGGPADVSMNTTARDPVRCASTTRRVTMPPIECPSSRRSRRSVRVGDAPARRRRAGRGSRRAGSSGASLSPCPRWSNVTTRWSRASASTWSAKSSLAPPKPWTRSRPGAVGSGRRRRSRGPRRRRSSTRIAANLRRGRTAGERTRNMREWRLPRRLARAVRAATSGSRAPPSSASASSSAPRCWRSSSPRSPPTTSSRKDTHSGTLAFLAARPRCSRSSASCSRPGAGSGCSRCSTSTCRCARCSAHYLAGQFVGNVLPSTIGGDVLRVSRGVEDHRHRRHRVRVGGHRAAERFRRAPAAHVRSASRSSRRCSSSTTRGSRSPSPAPRSSASS